MKKIGIILATLVLPLTIQAQDIRTDDLTDEYLDTVNVRKLKPINDYMSIGVNYGVNLSRMYFNPSLEQEWVFSPHYITVLFTKYCKMFDYLPYFGVEAGFSYGQQAFKLKQNPDSPYPNVLGFGTYEDPSYILEESMKVFKVPARAKFHLDVHPVRLSLDLGVYGGWRSDLKRIPYQLGKDKSLMNGFMKNENIFDYGMEGGAGIELIFDPVEFHFNVLCGWSWSSLYAPDSAPSKYNQYYYRYANPIDLMISFGIHFQLTKRSGKTTAQLAREAKNIVYGNPESKNRK